MQLQKGQIVYRRGQRFFGVYGTNHEDGNYQHLYAVAHLVGDLSFMICDGLSEVSASVLARKGR